MILAWVLLGAAVGVATTGPGGLTPRGLLCTVALSAALIGLLVTGQHDALAGILIGYGPVVVAEGVRALVGHWRHVGSRPEP